MSAQKRARTSRDRAAAIAHLRRRRIFCGTGLVIAAGFLLTGTQLLRSDPDAAVMHPAVLREPRQTPVVPAPFRAVSDKKEYVITPFFDYDQSALVVSANNKLALKPVLQLFRWRDMLNVNDLCVIWGENISSEVYKDMDFYQGAYTCFPRFEEGRAFSAHLRYRPHQLAHNHILTDDPKLRRRLGSVRAGDQVRIKGKLVSYAHQGQTLRTSSFTRQDNVCETIWLEEFEILRRHRPGLRAAMVVALIAAAGLAGGIIAATWRIIRLRNEEAGKKWTSWGRG